MAGKAMTESARTEGPMTTSVMTEKDVVAKAVLFAVVVGLFVGSYLFLSRPLLHSLSSTLPPAASSSVPLPASAIPAVSHSPQADEPSMSSDPKEHDVAVSRVTASQEQTEGKRPRSHGIDVSHDQGRVAWREVIASGIDFVYLKASDGMTFLDPMFAANMQALVSHPVLVGAYHFFEAEDDPRRQLHNFLQATQGHTLTLAPMVDVEVARGVKPKVLQARLRQFLKGVEQATGCTPVIYSYGDFWQTYIGRSFNHYPFWLADYSAEISRPAGLQHIQLWQHSEQGRLPGIRGAVDLDKALDHTALETIRCQTRREAI
ncbi:glycoside hydrolase family 25 protein [Vibrio rhizosphaerae]|uniref:Glycoside hydrolase family 25 protein n=1 Tax=Vibrio rhizosphaerae TaxID=398736 RepID=A0ABU4IZ98_9VIBR|nr:glycoside hydrolase family 25 protein [Vibrio rhizosphaerae]MDW6094238.1 glycoside hydrolase family 25 protein [Vibrio rhizosphaerae]